MQVCTFLDSICRFAHYWIVYASLHIPGWIVSWVVYLFWVLGILYSWPVQCGSGYVVCIFLWMNIFWVIYLTPIKFRLPLIFAVYLFWVLGILYSWPVQCGSGYAKIKNIKGANFDGSKVCIARVVIIYRRISSLRYRCLVYIYVWVDYFCVT